MVYSILVQATVNTVSFDNLHLFVPTFIPSPDKQLFFNESKKSFTPSFEYWTTDKKLVCTLEYHFDIGSAVEVNSPKNFIAAHETTTRFGVASKAIKVSVFDHIDVRKYLVESIMLPIIIPINTEITIYFMRKMRENNISKTIFNIKLL